MVAGDTCPAGVRKASHFPVLFGGRGQSAALGQSPPYRNTGPRATPFFVFLIEGRHVPACLPLLLLLLSGDIETNPGPYMCPTCNRPWTRRTGGIQCGGCDSWTHYNIRCSGVRQHGHIPQGWRCLICHPSHNTTLPPLPSPSTNFCSLAPGSVSHILLHCPSLQLHRASHHIHSLGQLWTHPRDCVAFLRDSAFI